MKKRRFNKSVLVIFALSLVILLGLVLFNTNFSFIGKKSIHEDARTYKTRHCLAFYPKGENGLKTAKQICKGVKDDRIFDYTLIPYGDYYQISYGGDYRYFTDKQYNLLKISEVSDDGKKMISDYIRYTYKKERPEQYYNAEFLKQLKVENIDFSNVTYSIEQEFLKCHVPQHEMDVYVPLKYIQKEINMNFGFPFELYVKPTYIDTNPEYPIIALTFDDGPQFSYEKGSTSTERIVNTLYDYDACGTFYVIGDKLQDRDVWSDYQVYFFLKDSINQGNEYASHTQTHTYTLTELSLKDDIYEEINGPIDYMKKFMEYDIKTYRPVSGEFNSSVVEASPVPAILWDIDSEDWYTRDVEEICAQILNQKLDSGDVLIFHDIYDETASAIERIVPELVNRGYQLVSVSELLKAQNIDIENLKYYYTPNDYE